MKDVNPCYGCVPPKRNPHCHSTCPEHKAWKEAEEKKKEAMRKEKKKNTERLDAIYKGIK